MEPRPADPRRPQCKSVQTEKPDDVSCVGVTFVPDVMKMFILLKCCYWDRQARGTHGPVFLPFFVVGIKCLLQLIPRL
jgi:hypothetical protein